MCVDETKRGLSPLTVSSDLRFVVIRGAWISLGVLRSSPEFLLKFRVTSCFVVLSSGARHNVESLCHVMSCDAREYRRKVAQSYAMDAASNMHSCFYRSGYDFSLPLAPMKHLNSLAEIAPSKRAFFLTTKVKVQYCRTRRCRTTAATTAAAVAGECPSASQLTLLRSCFPCCTRYKNYRKIGSHYAPL